MMVRRIVLIGSPFKFDVAVVRRKAVALLHGAREEFPPQGRRVGNEVAPHAGSAG